MYDSREFNCFKISIPWTLNLTRELFLSIRMKKKIENILDPFISLDKLLHSASTILVAVVLLVSLQYPLISLDEESFLIPLF